MRKIEIEMVDAVRRGYNIKKNNTEVVCDEAGKRVYLHGNCIYNHKRGEAPRYSFAGWGTTTTASRLNALGAEVRRKNWSWYNRGEAVETRGWFE